MRVRVHVMEQGKEVHMVEQGKEGRPYLCVAQLELCLLSVGL